MRLSSAVRPRLVRIGNEEWENEAKQRTRNERVVPARTAVMAAGAVIYALTCEDVTTISLAVEFLNLVLIARFVSVSQSGGGKDSLTFSSALRTASCIDLLFSRKTRFRF